MILGITPLPADRELYAVFADEKGEPRIVPCFALGLIELEGIKTSAGTNKVVAMAFCPGEHFQLADLEADFVSYATSADPAGWRVKCKAKRKELDEAARQLKHSGIYVPDSEVVGFTRR